MPRIFWTYHPYSLLASDNPASPAEAGHLDSRLKFPLRGTKQFKSAKRGTKNNRFTSFIKNARYGFLFMVEGCG